MGIDATEGVDTPIGNSIESGLDSWRAGMALMSWMTEGGLSQFSVPFMILLPNSLFDLQQCVRHDDREDHCVFGSDAVRSRIDWKYALGLELSDPGFDYSVLSKFRTRLIEVAAEQLLLDAMLTQFQAQGLLKSGGRARTDSTHFVAAVRTLNRLKGVGETLRAVLNDVAVVAPDWLRQQVTDDWFERYGKRIEASRLPKGEAQRSAYAEQIGADGLHLLHALYHESTPRWLREIPTVELLRQTWGHQHYTDANGQLRLLQAKDLPPAGMRMDSPYDPEAHFGTKRSLTWTGYKVHLTETCDANALHVITHVETTAAAVSDVAMTEPIHQSFLAHQKQTANPFFFNDPCG